MKNKRTGTIGRHILALTATILAVAALTGCFWTPEDARDGGITIDINTGAMGASAVQDFDGFFLGYVIADDLLRGDQATAEQAFAEVDVALQQALAFDAATFDENDFSVEISFPSIQLQADLFTGASGSSSFQGLRADAEYLVIVIAREWSISTAGVGFTDGVGFTTTTISAGENTSVSLEVSEANWTELDAFLQGRYGVDSDLQPEPEPEPGPLTIDIKEIPGVMAPSAEVTPVSAITETDQYTGTVSWSPSPDGGVFNFGTVYTATITLTAKDGYTLNGVPANFFTVAGATVTHAANSGVVTARFPSTAELASITINNVSVEGTFYYDLVSATSDPLPPAGSGTTTPYETWYSTVTILDPGTGDEIVKDSIAGGRTAMTSGLFEITGIVPDKSWRLMVVTWPEREYGDIGAVFLSQDFQLGSGATQTLDFNYAYSAGDFDTRSLYQTGYGSSTKNSVYARTGGSFYYHFEFPS